MTIPDTAPARETPFRNPDEGENDIVPFRRPSPPEPATPEPPPTEQPAETPNPERPQADPPERYEPEPPTRQPAPPTREPDPPSEPAETPQIEPPPTVEPELPATTPAPPVVQPSQPLREQRPRGVPGNPVTQPPPTIQPGRTPTRRTRGTPSRPISPTRPGEPSRERQRQRQRQRESIRVQPPTLIPTGQPGGSEQQQQQSGRNSGINTGQNQGTNSTEPSGSNITNRQSSESTNTTTTTSGLPTGGISSFAPPPPPQIQVEPPCQCPNSDNEDNEAMTILWELLAVPVVECVETEGEFTPIRTFKFVQALKTNTGSLKEAIQSQYEALADVAENACLLRNVKSEPIAFPEFWEVKRDKFRAQLVTQWKATEGNGYSRWSISIPHYIGPAEVAPFIPNYVRGDCLTTLVLNDNSQVTINAQSEAEGLAFMESIKPLIDGSKVTDSRINSTRVKRGKPIQNIEVTPVFCKYYGQGELTELPDWVAKFE